MLRELRRAIIPPRMIVEVTVANVDGTVTVTTPSGFTFNAIGSGTVGDFIYVQDGIVIGQAADLPHGDIDI